MNSLFEVLKEEELTTLKIRYDFRLDKFTFFAAKEWEKDTDFSRYNKDFVVDSILTKDVVYLDTQQVIDLFTKHGIIAYFNEVLSYIKQGKHFGVDFLFNAKSNIRFICGLHSNVRGRNNKSHATYAGATRRHPLEDEELEVIIDSLNLSRAMTFKNIAVNIAFGGCKSTAQMDPLDINDMQAMGFLAYSCDSTRCLTGPDMAFPKEMVKKMHENFTMQYCGGPGSPLGDTAVPTSYGAYLALKQAVKFQTGSESLDGMSIAVQGLGAIGYQMAKNLAKEKTKLFIADINKECINRFIEEHPNHEISVVDCDEIIKIEADIFAPCAMGGVIDEKIISELKFKYIMGPANNILKATNQEEEIRLAKLLADRDILFQTEWWHNAAGVLGASEEYLYGFSGNYTKEDLMKKVEDILPVQTWKNLNEAKERGITPTENAYRNCQDLIYGDL